VVIIPLIVALAVFLINKYRYGLSNKKLIRVCGLAKKESAFYGLMFSGYGIDVGLMVAFSGLGLIGGL
jgi:hypothetical protein